MTILRAANELVLCKIESVYGTAETLTGADAVQCDFELTPIEATLKERKFTRPYFGALPSIHTEIHRAIKMSNVEVAGSGTANVPPAWARIMRACGWSVTTGVSSVTMRPVTHAVDGLTIEPSIDGELFQMVGSKGTLSMMFEVSEFPTMEANLIGGWVDPETLVSVPTPDYTAWKIPRSVNCENTIAITLNAVDYPFYSFKIEQNSKVEFYCVPGEAGSRIELVDRNVKGTIKLQAKKISEHDLFALVRSNALIPLSMLHGTVAGAKVGITAPAVQLLNPRKSDYKGDLAWECDLVFTPTAADNEIAVVTS